MNTLRAAHYATLIALGDYSTSLPDQEKQYSSRKDAIYR